MKELEGTVSKILPLLLISLTSIIAIAVISIRERRATGSVYTFFSANPDTIGLLVQVISAALGACQIYAITSLINLSSRLRMQRGGPFEFRLLKFLAAITSGSSQALRTTLPATWLTVVVLVIFTLKVPAALWAGAMTPVLAEYVTDKGEIAVPTYPLSALPFWQGSFRRLANGTVDMSLNCNWTVTSDKLITGSVALVSTCPAIDLVSALLGSLATAAAGTVNTPRPHPRIDSSGWTILGRSFGVGSSPGIVPLQNLEHHQAPMVAFDYIENGYFTNVTCARNETSNYTIISKEDSAGAISYQVTGTLPNSIPGHVEEYDLASGTTTNNFLAWSAITNAGQNILAVAGTGNYKMFDKMQCIVDFQPTRFAVHVNVTNSIITAQADTANTSPAPDIEPTHQFATSVFYGLEQISRMSGNTIVSSLGVPLDHNTNIIADRNGTLDTNTSTALSLEYGIGTLIENLLVAEAQSQMFILQNTTNVPLSIQYHALRIGSDRYIYAVLVTNCVILLVILFECARTRLWKGLTIFDFADIQSMAVGASAGGKLLAEKWAMRREMGEESDHFAVALRARQAGWALIPADKATFMYDVVRQVGDTEGLSLNGSEMIKMTDEVSIVGSDVERSVRRGV